MEETLQFNEDFIKSYNKDSDMGYFLEVDVQYPDEIHERHNNLPFFQKEWKLKKLKNLYFTCTTINLYVAHVRNSKQH